MTYHLANGGSSTLSPQGYRDRVYTNLTVTTEDPSFLEQQSDIVSQATSYTLPTLEEYGSDGLLWFLGDQDPFGFDMSMMNHGFGTFSEV